MKSSKFTCMIKSRIHLLFLLFSFLFFSFAWADANIQNIQAYRLDSKIVLQWTTESETNVLRFDIQRSTDQENWQKIDHIAAAGNSNVCKYYSYEDNQVFKSCQACFYYRLAIINTDGTVKNSIIASVSGESGIKQTWGSIKAMFR